MPFDQGVIRSEIIAGLSIVEKFRRDSRYSPGAYAEFIGTTPTLYNKYMSGEKLPHFSTLVKWLKKIGYSTTITYKKDFEPELPFHVPPEELLEYYRANLAAARAKSPIGKPKNPPDTEVSD